MFLPFAAIALIAGAAPRTPVLVELFTSEGCSSCPPADALLQELARTQPLDGAEIVPLSLHVDYWDDLGWRDPFDAPEFTARQNAYASRFGEQSVYTPEFVVDGDAHFPASRARALEAIAEAARRPHLAIELKTTRTAHAIEVVATVGPTEPGAELWVAITEGPLRSKVTAGENRGRELEHIAVARRLVRLGAVPSAGGRLAGTIALDPAWQRPLGVVAFVQRTSDRRILGCSRSR